MVRFNRFDEIALHALKGNQKKAEELQNQLMNDFYSAVLGKGTGEDPRVAFRNHMQEIRSELTKFKIRNGYY